MNIYFSLSSDKYIKKYIGLSIMPHIRGLSYDAMKLTGLHIAKILYNYIKTNGQKA